MARTKLENELDVDALRKQVEELSAMVALLTKTKESYPEITDDKDDEINKIKINSDDYIKVMSIYPYTLNLTTLSKGKGKIFTFSKAYEVKRILYSDLNAIMENHRNFLEQGYFVILNRDVVRRHGLDDAYGKILTKENIESIASGNQTDAINLFKNANASQQQFVVDSIINRMVAGEVMDLNLLDRLSRIIGYNIQERAEETKQYIAMNVAQKEE
jgi:hypothetical protein